MTRFVAVVHQWFVDSNGFTVVEISARNEAGAQRQANALRSRMHQTFSKAAVTVLTIRDHETVKPRRLTIRERITGRLAGDPQ